MTVITTINPKDESVTGKYTLMEKDEVNAIIAEMHHVQQQWMHTAISERKQCLKNTAQLLHEQKERLATIITNEMGKPIEQAIAEVEKCARLCDYYAQRGNEFMRPEMIQTEFSKTYRSFKALGIVFAIMPWNFPLWQVMRFAVPNLMLGNAGLLKHAPNCLGTSLAIETLFMNAGFPKNLFRSLLIDVDLAPLVIHHPHVAGVTLTGSNRAGEAVGKEAGMALKKVVLELGGSDPYVILADADLDFAAEQCVKSRLSNAGQVCIAAKRIIVVDEIKNAFEKLIIEKAKTYQTGDPLDKNTKMGPMARADLREKVQEQVDRSIQDGAKCALGGQLPEGKGFYYPATVLLDVDVESPAFLEEIFGPVICVTSAKDEAEAIKLANHTHFGLAGAIFTRDLKKGEQLARDYIEAGTCAVNVLVASDPRLPFGGIKQSGHGRELSLEGMREFANIKTIIINDNTKN